MRMRAFLLVWWCGLAVVGSCVGQAAPLAGAAQDEKPAEMTERAYHLIQQGDLQTAAALLDHIKAINAEEPRLWGCYGDLALRHGELQEAVADYQQELKLHPAMVQVYLVLMQTQMMLKRNGDAMASAQRWAQAAPGDGRPLSVLAAMQLEAGRNDDAARSAEAGLARPGGNGALAEALRVTLGKAEMKLGQQEKARALLVQVLGPAENPLLINNVAYELVNAGLELPLCEAKVKTAMRAMEEQSRDWTLEQAMPQLRAGTMMLQSTWDTLGWTYFKEGKLDLAEQYIKASWLGRQSQEIGRHLAEVEAARGNKAQAALTLRLAQASAPSADGQEVPVPQAAVPGKGSRSVSMPEQLQAMRKIPLGKGPDGAAEYKVLVGPLGMMTEKPEGTKEMPQAAELLVRARTAALFPASEQGQLMYLVMLSCRGGECAMELQP